MNGTIDLSDGRHDNADTRRHDDELGQLEGWDESDSLSSCSCSSCSTCSLCDICGFDDFDQLNTNRPADASSLEGNIRTLSFSNEKTDVPRKNDNFPDLNYDTCRKVKPSNREPVDDESGIFTYSSGSDKDTVTQCAESNSHRDDKFSTSSSEHGKKHGKKKKVTFLESSLCDGNPGRFSMESVKTAKKNIESRHYAGNQNTACYNRVDNYNTKWNPNVDLEHKRLESVLDNIDPFKLHSIMKHQLRTKNTQAVLALGKLLPKSRYSGETVHCVRCHKEYSPQYGKKDCYLDHPKTELTITYQKGNTAYYKCRVCKKEYWVQQQKDDPNGVNIGHCYVGKHTARPDDTVYFPVGAAQRCEDRGCIEFYV